jgi:hypothetical protein
MITRDDEKKARHSKAYLAQMLNAEQIEKMCEIVDKVLLNKRVEKQNENSV